MPPLFFCSASDVGLQASVISRPVWPAPPAPASPRRESPANTRGRRAIAIEGLCARPASLEQLRAPEKRRRQRHRGHLRTRGDHRIEFGQRAIRLRLCRHSGQPHADHHVGRRQRRARGSTAPRPRTGRLVRRRASPPGRCDSPRRRRRRACATGLGVPARRRDRGLRPALAPTRRPDRRPPPVRVAPGDRASGPAAPARARRYRRAVPAPAPARGGAPPRRDRSP